MYDYVKLVIMFFMASWLNNYALNFHISIPLLMIFRSGSLMANMVLGIFILNKTYDIWKYISVLMITLGIFVCTIATGSDMKQKSQADDKVDSFFYWIIGVAMLAVALFISARMGLYQEVLYKKRGKHVREALFFTHFLAMPAFVVMGVNIFNHFIIATQSNIVTIPLLNLSTPVQIIYLVINFLSHYLCVSCVYTLTAETSSLTVTMVVTIRKFASLVYSIIYFRHPFTSFHWFGTILIIIGTVMFTEIIPKIKEILREKAPETEPLINEEDVVVFSKPSLYKKFFVNSKKKLASLSIPKPHKITYHKLNTTEKELK
jgi:solute carrier family 35 (UDP-xylose/UDP-N-acetylglucosamine transporter), member B4